MCVFVDVWNWFFVMCCDECGDFVKLLFGLFDVLWVVVFGGFCVYVVLDCD